MPINAYLTFKGNCQEAFDFYAKVLGGEIQMVMKNSDAPTEYQGAPEGKDQIMHIRLAVEGGFLMGSDAPPQYYSQPQGFSVSLTIEDVARGKQIFDAFAEGGIVQMPFDKTFWAEGFGMVIDKYSTPWIINAGSAPM